MRRMLKILMILLAGIGLLLGVDFWSTLEKPLGTAQTDIFVVDKGATAKAVALELQRRNLFERPYYFIAYAMATRVAQQLKAGEYRLTPGMTARQLLQDMVAGHVVIHSFTIVEGWTFRQLLQAVKKNSLFAHELDYSRPENISAQLGYPNQHPEGWIYPDTYAFSKGTTDLEFLQRAWKVMHAQLEEEWQNREAGLPLRTPYEALILASIIEKETAQDSERQIISSVFINRLQQGMRLQTDPTVIYGMQDKYNGDIRYRDLRADTPYNTYTRKGLPPTPIALPGIASLRAALHPAETDRVYFVARGNGFHQFSRTLAEHQLAVDQFQRRKK